jgi:8-oxo-dGTP pyrophosphatase MutT (NUDIX family)
MKYGATSIDCRRLQPLARASNSLPLQVAAVCYRCQGENVEFLLVNTNGGNKWTFPKGSPMARLSHSQSAEQEAAEEAGAIGSVEPRHFHLYIHSKGVFWQPGGVQEYVVKAFLMEVHQLRRPDEAQRRPTWFNSEEARKRLAKGREVKYAHELEAVIDRALERIHAQRDLLGRYSEGRNSRAAAP